MLKQEAYEIKRDQSSDSAVSPFWRDIDCYFAVTVDYAVIVTVNDPDKLAVFVFDDKEIVIIVFQVILYPAVEVL